MRQTFQKRRPRRGDGDGRTRRTVGVGITRHSACQSTPELELPFGRMLRTLARPPPLIERTDGRQRTSKSGTLRRFFVSLVDGCLDCMINLPTVYTANRIVGRIRLSLTDPYIKHNGTLRFLKNVGSSSNEISKQASFHHPTVGASPRKRRMDAFLMAFERRGEPELI